MTWIRLQRAAVASALLLTLGGCSTPAEQYDFGLPGPLPPDTLCPEPACADAAASYFMTLHGPAVRGEDFAMWEALSLPTCEFCLDTLAVKDENFASGAVVTGADVSVLPWKHIAEETETGVVALVFDVKIDEAIYHYPDDTTASIPEMVLTLWVGMEWNGDYWQVKRIGVT